MGQTVTVDLTKRKDLSDAIKNLKQYRDDILNKKIDEFLNELATVGIEAARVRMADSRYKDYITFGSTVEVGDKVHHVVLLYGRNTKMLERTWLLTATGNKTGQSTVNPILMSEFGSGAYASISGYMNAEGIGGRGTHPTQKHAFDKGGWWWYEEVGDPTSDHSTYVSTTDKTNREKHFSRGEVADRPLLTAVNEMQRKVRTVAEKVFG